MGTKPIIALVCAAVALAACKSPNKSICSTPPPLDVSGETNGSWINVDGCLNRWAYRLAIGPDSSTVTAEAVVGACYDAIDKWSQKVVGFDEKLADYREPVTGRVVDYRANMFQQARSYALFYVVQARAGNCAVP